MPNEARTCAYRTLGDTSELVFEMLDALETVTVAGQQYLMEKVVAVLRRDTLVPEAALDALSREARRMVPDARGFSARVSGVVRAVLSS